MDDRLEGYLRSKLRAAGRRYAEAREEYEAGRAAADRPGDGEVRIVCRRYAEKRAVELDAEARPPCFDPDHADCRGCVEDIRDGTVETW